MVKSREKAEPVQVKLEDASSEHQKRLLHGAANDNSARITKRHPSNKTVVRVVLPPPRFKLEDVDTKAPRQKSNKYSQGEYVTQEKINEIIGYLVNDQISEASAARKAKVNVKTVRKYHKRYKDDPEHKIPLPYRLLPQKPAKLTPIQYFTEKEIETFINDITHGKMTRSAAAKKANMSYSTATKYHLQHLNNPSRKSLVHNKPDHLVSKLCTVGQIKDLIRYIEEEKLTVTEAGLKAGMGHSSATKYYNIYKNDPEHKIPVPHLGPRNYNSLCTQDQVDKLIHYIVDEKLSIRAAAKKANMSAGPGNRYYRLYLTDPERKIPKVLKRRRKGNGNFTFEQIKSLIGYIVDDKMTLRQAAEKADMTEQSARRYHLIYLTDPEKNIPMPRSAYKHVDGKYTSYEKVKEVIGYIVDDRMSLQAAALKAKIGESTASKYYQQYLNDPNQQIPVPGNNTTTARGPSQDQLEKFASFIINDKLSVVKAAKKANIGIRSAKKYYSRYLENPDQIAPSFGVDFKSIDNDFMKTKIKNLFEYILQDKMSMAKAAAKADISEGTARKYYRRYLDDPERKIPEPKTAYTYQQIKKLISLIEKDDMEIKDAAKEVNMSHTSAIQYYRKYKKDPEHKIPIRCFSGYQMQKDIYNEQIKVIRNFYEKNKAEKAMQKNGASNPALHGDDMHGKPMETDGNEDSVESKSEEGPRDAEKDGESMVSDMEEMPWESNTEEESVDSDFKEVVKVYNTRTRNRTK